MSKLRSDGITHAVRVRRLRWRALCGHAFMIEGDPLPNVAGQIDCMGCIDASNDFIIDANDEAAPIAA